MTSTTKTEALRPFTTTLPEFDTTSLAIGDIVTIHPEMTTAALRGVYFKITKLPVGARGVNYGADPVTGGRGVLGPRYTFVKVTDPAKLAAAEAAEKADTPALVLGSTVRFKTEQAALRSARFQGTFVVIKLGANGYNLAKLGGDDNRFLRSVPGTSLEIVDLGE